MFLREAKIWIILWPAFVVENITNFRDVLLLAAKPDSETFAQKVDQDRITQKYSLILIDTLQYSISAMVKSTLELHF